nr:hypothetical protein [Tanacetum cinerariifolium]
MADQRTMAELLRAPTEGYAEAIVVPSILAEQFELKHSLINMMTTDQFFGLEKDSPHDHIRWGSPSMARKRTPAFYSYLGGSCFQFFPPIRKTNLRNEISNFQQRFNESFHEAWDRYKDLFRACPYHGFTKLHQLDTFYNALNPADQDSLNAATGGNLLERPSVKSIEEICVTCGGAHPYYQCLTAGGNTFPELRDNIQGYVSAAAVNYNQGNSGYRPSEQSYQAPAPQNQTVPLNELEKVKRMNEVNMKALQTQINMVKNELRNEMKKSIQASLSNQTNEIKNMMASLFQMNSASTSGSGSLPSNTVPKGELKSITTRSGHVFDGPTVPTPLPFINPKEDERVEETLTDPDLYEYTIKVPHHPVQKYKPPSQREYVVHQRDPLHPNIPYPLRMLKQKQQEKDEYQKMLKALLSNKEKLQELANTPLNENYSVVILKKLPEKLGDPGKFLISCGFSELKRKALADLGASINLMPLSVWKKLGLPELIFTRITLKLANQEICTPVGIARDVIVSVSKFTFPADFVIVDYESDPRVPLILGRPFLRTARALIGVHGEEMILCDGDERFTLNMRHDTSSYSNQPQKESINLINVFNNSKVESDAENVYDPFDTKGEKIKYSKLLIDELDLPCDFLPSDQENPFEIITLVVQDKKLATSNASLVLEDFDPPFYEPLFFKEALRSNMLLLFSSENEEKVFKPGIHTFEKVHSSFIPELSHQGYKIFKINQIFKSPMKIFFSPVERTPTSWLFLVSTFTPLISSSMGELGQAK